MHALRANDDPSPTGIDGDVNISIAGLKQAQELAAHLAKVHPKIDTVYSSPFYRCLKTVEPFCMVSDLQVNIEPGLGEYYYKGRPTIPVPPGLKESSQRFDIVNQKYQQKFASPTTGETRSDLQERVRRTLVELEKDGHETVLLITHAATKIVIGEVLTGTSVRAGTCSLDRYDFTDKWVLTLNGSTDFLENGEEMNWSFDMHVEAGSKDDERSRQTKTTDQLTTVYLPLDLGQANVRTGETEVEAVGLNTDNPVFRVGNIVCEGHWQNVAGTELYTSNGDVVGSARQRIVLQPTQTEQHPAKLRERVKEIVERSRSLK